MKTALCIALSRRAGQTLTVEMARQIVLEATARPDLSFGQSRFGHYQYRGLTFQVERFRAIEEEIHPLHQAHYLETEAHRKGIPMDPDYAAFSDMELDGGLIQFTARNASGALVGNIRMHIFTSLHTRTLEAREDTFYLLPEYRKGFTAIRFWQFMEGSLRAIGVTAIQTDSKVVNQVGRLNEYLGYKHVANVFHKFLGA